MEVSEKEVESYVRPDGSCPFNEWLDSVHDRQARARIKLVILLCGGDKSSQTDDIRKAIEYWEDYKKLGVNHG